MAYHKYVNNTGTTQHFLLPNIDFNKVSDFSLVPNASVILEYPGLDRYVPHKLAKITENGEDLSHLVVREREETDRKANLPLGEVIKSIPPPVIVFTEPKVTIVEQEVIIVEPKAEILDIATTPDTPPAIAEEIKPKKTPRTKK